MYTCRILYITFAGLAESLSYAPEEVNATSLSKSNSCMIFTRSNQITTKRHFATFQPDGTLPKQSEVFNAKMAKL